jgi:putative hydrolase of the HAD superfamily
LPSSNGFSTILFDLDGTLRYDRPSPSATLYDSAFRLGASDSPERRRRCTRWTHYYWAQSAEMLEDLQAFGSSEADFWTNFYYRSLIAFDCPPEQAQELASQIQRQMSVQEWEDWVPPEVPTTLQALRERGFHLGVVSNRTDPFHEQLSILGLKDYFSCSLAAGQVNSWKPEVVIFQHALELLGTQPAHTLYIGDNYYADVLGARAAGLEPVLIDPDEIFPEADCAVIHCISEILPLLEQY